MGQSSSQEGEDCGSDLSERRDEGDRGTVELAREELRDETHQDWVDWTDHDSDERNDNGVPDETVGEPDGELDGIQASERVARYRNQREETHFESEGNGKVHVYNPLLSDPSSERIESCPSNGKAEPKSCRDVSRTESESATTSVPTQEARKRRINSPRSTSSIVNKESNDPTSHRDFRSNVEEDKDRRENRRSVQESLTNNTLFLPVSLQLPQSIRPDLRRVRRISSSRRCTRVVTLDRRVFGFELRSLSLESDFLSRRWRSSRRCRRTVFEENWVGYIDHVVEAEGVEKDPDIEQGDRERD